MKKLHKLVEMIKWYESMNFKTANLYYNHKGWISVGLDANDIPVREM